MNEISETQELGIICRVKSFLYGDKPNLDPKDILERLNKNEVIKKLENGEIVFLSKYKEGMSGKGADAFEIIQQGLIALELIKIDKNKECWWTSFKFGVYGDKTIAAVKKFQEKAGIKYKRKVSGQGFEIAEKLESPDGHKIGQETIKVLKKALEAASKGKNWEVAFKK